MLRILKIQEQTLPSKPIRAKSSVFNLLLLLPLTLTSAQAAPNAPVNFCIDGTCTPNGAPVWAANTPTALTRAAGAVYNFSQHASDPESDALTYSIASNPGGYTIVPSAGTVTIGTVSGGLAVRATDPHGLYAEHVCQITVNATAGIEVPRVYDEPHPAEVVTFPSAYNNYQILRPRVSHLTYPDILPPDFEGFNIGSACTVYVWSIATVVKSEWNAVLSGGIPVTATGSFGNVWKLYSPYF